MTMPRVLTAVHYQSSRAPKVIADGLSAGYINTINRKDTRVDEGTGSFPKATFVCVGSARFAGDSLGPRVGSRLRHNLSGIAEFKVWGTMAEPVHGANLSEVLNSEVFDTGRNAGNCIIVVDGVIGEKKALGTCFVGLGRFRPGEAMGCERAIPAFGDIYVVACVGVDVQPGCCLCLPAECLDEIGAVLASGILMFARTIKAVRRASQERWD